MSYYGTVLGTTGLVSLWELGESSGNALDGKSLNPGLPKNEAGLTRAQPSILPNGEGKSCKFTAASSGYFELPDTASLDVGDTFSIELWVLPITTASARQIFSSPSGGPTMYVIATTDIVEVDKRALTALFKSTGAISSTTPTHVVATKNGEARKLYFNGVDVTSLIGNAAVEKPAGAYTIGKDGPGTNFFNGTMQDLALYNVALSEATVKEHYEAALPEPIRPKKPSLDLTVEIEGVNGERFRLTPDARARDRYRGLTFGTLRGEGFTTASYQLNRPIFRDYPDVAVLGTQRFVGEQGDIAYEGMLHSNPRNNNEGPILEMSLVGFAFLLKSSLISPLIIDRRLGGWQPPSTERLSILAAANISLVGSMVMQPNNYVIQLKFGKPYFEKVGIGSALVDNFTNVTTKPVVTEAGELDYFSGPEDIGELRYDFRSLVGAEEAAWDNNISFGVESTIQTTPVSGTDHNAKTALLQKKAVGASGYHYIRIRDWLNAASEGANLTRIFAWGNVRVIGTHGLVAIGEEPNEGYRLSDIISYILRTYYPQITWAGQTNTFPVAQATWHDSPTSGYDIISALNELSLWETNIYEGPSFYYEAADLTSYDWIVRTDQPGVEVTFQGDTIEDFANGIVVSFEDFTGKKQVLYPEAYPELQDTTETNPANQRDLKLWTSTEVPWQCLEAEAIQFGRIKLAEYNRPKRAGTITVQGHIQDEAGKWHPAWKVRASDSIGVLDHPSDEPRLIHATSYDDESKTMTITVDGLPQDLDAVIARHEVAFQARNLR